MFPAGFSKLEDDITILIQKDLDFAVGQTYESDIGDVDIAEALKFTEDVVE
jgi:hypothetical protein